MLHTISGSGIVDYLREDWLYSYLVTVTSGYQPYWTTVGTMAAVAINTNDAAAPLGCVLPCSTTQAKAPLEKPMTDVNADARCLKTAAVARGRDAATVPLHGCLTWASLAVLLPGS